METVSKEEQEIRDRIVKCMEDYADRERWCTYEFKRRNKDFAQDAIRQYEIHQLYLKCHRSVIENIEIENAVKGNA